MLILLLYSDTNYVLNDETFLIVGGYHGNVIADLLAYSLPSMVQVRPIHSAISEHFFGEIKLK